MACHPRNPRNPRLETTPLQQEPQVPDRKIPQLRKDHIDVGVIDSEPPCKSSGILIHRSCGYPSAASVGVVRTAQLECREYCAIDTRHTIEVAADHGSTHDEVMIAPRVVGSDGARRPSRLERASEIGERERDDLRFELELNRSIVRPEA